MKIIEQYLKAIGYALPVGKRKDIQEELRSLLLDEIEARGGENPSEETVQQVIETFGSPSEVAARYRSGQGIISEAFRDIYFLILKIVFGALAIAFTVLFFIELATEPVSGTALVLRVLRIPLLILNAGLSATGAITLVFIALTRYYGDHADEVGLSGKTWSVKDLKDISIEEETGSLAGAVAGLLFGGIAVLLLLVYPEILSVMERSFERSGIQLGHLIHIDTFVYFTWVFAALWLLEMAVQVLIIRQGRKTVKLAAVSTGVSLLQLITFGIMVFLPSLYITAAERTPIADAASEFQFSAPSWVGFRLVFLIVALATAAEIAVWTYRRIRDRV